jgi:hypothetical protein
MRLGGKGRRWTWRRALLIAAAGVCALAGLAFAVSDEIRGHLYFNLLQTWSHLEHKAESKPVTDWLVARLAESPTGVRLAAQDCNIIGGTTRAYSSVILLHSGLTAEVIAELESAAADPGTPMARKVEALSILWDRTHDPEYARRLFLSVRDPVTDWYPLERTAVKLGRDKLALMFPDTRRPEINLLPSLPLRIKEEEFVSMLVQMRQAPATP